MNTINIQGTVGRIEDAFETKSGKLIGKFSVADNKKNNETRWFTMEAWNEDAELIYESLSVGDKVELEGYVDRAEAYLNKNNQPQAKMIVALTKLVAVEKKRAA